MKQMNKYTPFFIGFTILIIVSFTLFGSYQPFTTLEGLITADDVKAAAAEKNAAMVKANKPVSTVELKSYSVLITDAKQYSELELRSKSTFTNKNPDFTYLVSGTSEEMPNQNATPVPFKLANPTNARIPTEISKFNGFIAISPKDKETTFPPAFQLTVTNNRGENQMEMWLWGVSPNRDTVPSNGIIGSDNINTVPYSKTVFSMKDNSLMVAGVNIGNNAINAFGIGPIYDRGFRKIGEVTAMGNDITINCTDSTNITGILFYLGKPDKIK